MAIATAAVAALAWSGYQGMLAPPVVLVACVVGSCVVLLHTLVVYYLPRHQKRIAALEKEQSELAELYHATTRALADAIDAKCGMGRLHAVRVQRYAVAIAEHLSLPKEVIEGIRIAALLHDIGMLGVPEHIISKPGRLSEEEYSRVMSHPQVAARILHSVPFPWPVVDYVCSHQERWDGSGYPQGSKEREIPKGARVLAVADVYVSLTSKRVHRPALPRNQALAYMRQQAGVGFDPDAVRALLAVVDRLDAETAPAYQQDHLSLPDASAPRRSVMEDIADANHELLALYEIAQTMGSTLSMAETLQLIISKVRSIFSFSTCAVLLMDELREGMVCELATDLHADNIRGAQVPLTAGVSGEVATKGEGMLGGPPTAEFGPAPCDLLSAAVAPLRAEDEVIGTINIYHTKPHAYSADDLRLLSLVARQAAVAIENARVFEQTKASALTDLLTGLPNARYLFLHLEQEIGRSRRTGRPLSILGLDLDNFKPVNDLFGHKQGDRVLKELAEVFKAQVREYDTVVRHAGDEFIVVLPETGRLEAADTAARIKDAVNRYDARLRQRFAPRLAVSIGIATYPDHGTEPGTLIAYADAQMYADKRARKAEQHLAGALGPRDH